MARPAAVGVDPLFLQSLSEIFLSLTRKDFYYNTTPKLRSTAKAEYGEATSVAFYSTPESRVFSLSVCREVRSIETKSKILLNLYMGRSEGSPDRRNTPRDGDTAVASRNEA